MTAEINELLLSFMTDISYVIALKVLIKEEKVPEVVKRDVYHNS